MFNEVERNAIVEEYVANTSAMFKETKGKYNIAEAMASCSSDLVRDNLKCLQNIMIGCIPTGIPIPRVAMYVHATGTNVIKVIKLKICNTVVGPQEFKYSTRFTENTTLDYMFEYIQSVYTDLLTNELININLEVVNDLLSKVTTTANLNYEVKIISPLGCENKAISYISDDKIVFVADPQRVFDLDDVIVLFDEERNGITQEIIDKHVQALVEEFEAVQTTAQLVGIRGGALISYVCDISKRVKPFTLIKKVCTRNVKNLTGSVDCLAYFNEGSVFSIVSRKDEQYDVVLSPINTETLLQEDFNVLSAIG